MMHDSNARSNIDDIDEAHAVNLSFIIDYVKYSS